MEGPGLPPERPDRGSLLIAVAIVGAAFVLSWGMSSSQPRYQLAASGQTVVRMDTDSGELIACDQHGCGRIEAPARAKVLGPLTVQFGPDVKKALPPPSPEQNNAAR